MLLNTSRCPFGDSRYQDALEPPGLPKVVFNMPFVQGPLPVRTKSRFCTAMLFNHSSFPHTAGYFGIETIFNSFTFPTYWIGNVSWKLLMNSNILFQNFSASQ